RDVLDLLVLDAFVHGREPYAHSTTLENVRPDAPLAPPQARLVREAVDDSARTRLLTGEGWTLRSTYWRERRRADVQVTAVTSQLAASVLAAATEGATDTPPETDERVA